MCFLQEMTNNAKLAFSVGDTTYAVSASIQHDKYNL